MEIRCFLIYEKPLFLSMMMSMPTLRGSTCFVQRCIKNWWYSFLTILRRWWQTTT